MVDCKPCSTPMAIKPSLSASDNLPFSQPAFYRSLVGGLQYLTITRPDLALAVNHASQDMQAPTVAHFALVKKLLRYVKGTLSHGLQFSPGPFHLHACTDANWAGDSSDRRSTSGFCVFWGLISSHGLLKSSLQSLDQAQKLNIALLLMLRLNSVGYKCYFMIFLSLL